MNNSDFKGKPAFFVVPMNFVLSEKWNLWYIWCYTKRSCQAVRFRQATFTYMVMKSSCIFKTRYANQQMQNKLSSF